MDSLINRTETILKTQLESSDPVAKVSSPQEVEEALRLIEDLKYFLATAPANWQENQIIRRYYLNSEHGFVSCVFWNNVYYITGTDIVKCCLYRMQKFGRTIVQKKKFEEGIFSDLRNLKCGMDATLEQPKSEFLQFLYRNSCLKTQKKQKVFFWFSVPHDKLFTDALERDLKREETSNQQATTKAISEPAVSFHFDSKSGTRLYEQLLTHTESKRFVAHEPELDSLNVTDPKHIQPQQDALSQLIKSEDGDDTGVHDSYNKNIVNNDIPNIIPDISYNENKTDIVSRDDTNSNTPTIIGASEETLLPSRNMLTINTPTLKLDLDNPTKMKVVQSIELPDTSNDIDENEGDYLKEKDGGRIGHITTTTFEDIPLDYFPIDIEYPDKDMEFEDPINGNVGMVLPDYNFRKTPRSAKKSATIKFRRYKKPYTNNRNNADPFLLEQDGVPGSDNNMSDLTNLNVNNDDVEEQERMMDNDINDAFEDFDNGLAQSRNGYYNTQPTYNNYMNVNMQPYRSDIMPQTIEQPPFTGFETLYTPQNLYKDYFYMAQSQPQPPPPPQLELFDWNTLLQPTSSLPQLTTSHSINYTPGYRANPPQAIWVQSPYMANGQNQYHQKKTPLVSRRRQFHNLTPASGMKQYAKNNGKMGKISKQSHTKRSDVIKEQPSYQKRRR